MGLQISHETEARITNEARRQGVSVDELLERLMKERGASVDTHAEAIERQLVPVEGVTPELPVLHLGAMGALRRRDIYDDVR